jgi:GMP synthase-like glutamine amidotransferase
MKPILVLQNMHSDSPGYLGTWLQEQGLAFEVRSAASGDPWPDSMQGHSGLAVLGGAMSANDPLPFLRATERLILDAMDRDRPVIGHCLGGQLMARALGVRVHASPAPEIGWQAIEVVDGPEARAWLGTEPRATVMQWHYEAFELPPGATLLARSAACAHQAFAIGPHLGMQFHIEMDAAKVEAWMAEGDPLWASAQERHPASVQDPATLLAQAPGVLPAHQTLARQVYGRWARGLDLTS